MQHDHPTSASNTTSSAKSRFPPTPTGACTRPARSRTSRSPGTPISAMPDLMRALRPTSRRRRRAPTPSSACSTAKRAGAIIRACDDLIAGKLPRPVRGRRDPGRRRHLDQHERQRGDRQPARWRSWAIEKGRYDVLHPNDHVNASQSTNDVYPTAVRLALWSGIDRLLESMADAARRLRGQGRSSSSDVLKIGRTQLQDAVPMTLGQEFSTYAVMIGEDEAAPARGARADPGNQPRRDRDRHRHQCAARLRRAGLPATWPRKAACRW